MKKTVLHDVQKQQGAKMVDFHGWRLPVQYEGIMTEHHAVRARAGLFDVSHMGHIRVGGLQSEAFVQKMLTADVSQSYSKKRAVYTMMLNEKGGIIDDLIVMAIGRHEFHLIVNASNVQKNLEHLKGYAGAYEVTINELTSTYAKMALQGPKSEDVLQKHTKSDIRQIAFFRFETDVEIESFPCVVSQTGYTGEKGYELIVPVEGALKIWEALANEPEVTLCGLGARDTLRFEASLPLYGNELDESTTPAEASLMRFVDENKEVFVGKEGSALAKKQRVGLRLCQKGVPRSGYEVRHNDKPVGVVTSGGYCPSLQASYAMAFVELHIETENICTIMIRNKAVQAKVVRIPFYRRKKTI